MKRMMLAVVAAMVVGAAQAVTQRWDDWQKFNYNTGEGVPHHWVSGDNLPTFSSSASFAIKTTLVLGSDFNWNSQADKTGLLLTIASGNNRYAFQGAGTGGESHVDIAGIANPGDIIVGDWVHGTNYAWDKATNTKVSLTAGGSYTFMFAYDKGTFSAYLNDKWIADCSSWGEDWKITGIGLGRDELGTHSLPSKSTGSYEFTDFEYSTKMIPEPTALALLALGVAGLALRRRVA